MSITTKSRAEMAQETTDRLIAVARNAFATEGFAAVSLDAVAAEAGVTRGALHHHFTNKAGLFEAVLRRIDAEIGVEIDRVWEATPDPWAGFQACFHTYLDAILRPDRRRIVFQDAPAVLGNKAYEILFGSGLADVVGALSDLISSGRVHPADPVALAHLVNGATDNLAFWAAEDETRRATAHQTLSLLFRGLEA
jgi:AcrR family transcriptional regulator